MQQKKGGKAFIIVGGTGAGKTTFIKKCLDKIHPEAIHLYDVNNEYGSYYNRPLLPFEKFCEESQRLREAVIIFEEATIFLNNRGSNEKLTDMLVRKRHTGNTYFLVFHSLRAIPKYILNLCNFVVLHKTSDPVSIVEAFDIPQLLDAYRRIKEAPYQYTNDGWRYSPHEIVPILL